MRVSFSPVPECVEIGLLESSCSDPAAAPGTPLLLLLYIYPHGFPLRVVGDRFLKADSSYKTIFIVPSIHLLYHLFISYTIYTFIIHLSVELLYHLYIDLTICTMIIPSMQLLYHQFIDYTILTSIIQPLQVLYNLYKYYTIFTFILPSTHLLYHRSNYYTIYRFTIPSIHDYTIYTIRLLMYMWMLMFM